MTDWSLRPLLVLLVLLAGSAAIAGAGSAAATPVGTDTSTVLEDRTSEPTQNGMVFALQTEGNESQSDTESESSSDAADSEPGGDTESESDESGTDDTDTDSSSESTDDGSGSDGDAETTVEPEAAMDVPSTVEAGTSVTVDATASDPGSDDEIVRYSWEIDDGDASVTNTSEPRLEYTFDDPGTATIDLVVVTDADRRAETSSSIDVTVGSATVEGRVVHPHDESRGFDAVQLRDGTSVVAETRTAVDGSFTLTVDDPGTYSLVYIDRRLNDQSLVLRPDGYVDFYAIEEVTIDDSTDSVDVGQTVLPDANTVEAVVVGEESEQPFEDVPVEYIHQNNGAEIRYETETDENGSAFAESDEPLEVGSVIEVKVIPRRDNGFTTEHFVSKNLYIDENTTRTIELSETINATLDVEPNPPALGDNVTVTLNETRGIADSVTWTVDGESPTGPTERIERSLENQSSSRAANGDTEHALEIRPPEIANYTVRATVVGVNGAENTTTTTINITEPIRELRLDVPDETRTREWFTVTARPEIEAGNASFETYDWALRSDDGELVATDTTSAPTTEFRVPEIGQYTLELTAWDEFGVPESANATIDDVSVPTWVTAGGSHFEIDDVSVPSAVGLGETVTVTVTTVNTGEVSDRTNVTLEADGDVLASETVSVADGASASTTLTHVAPEDEGTHTLSVSTDHERSEVSYTVGEAAEPGSITTRPASASADADADEPEELDLLPTPSTEADIETVSPPRDRLRTALLGVAVAAILGGVALVGAVVYARLDRDPLEVLSGSPPSDESR